MNEKRSKLLDWLLLVLVIIVVARSLVGATPPQAKAQIVEIDNSLMAQWKQYCVSLSAWSRHYLAKIESSFGQACDPDDLAAAVEPAHESL